jgi:hypothetical protein
MLQQNLAELKTGRVPIHEQFLPELLQRHRPSAHGVALGCGAVRHGLVVPGFGIGAEARAKGPGAVTIFIMPPSLEAWKESLLSRLTQRGIDNPAALGRRLAERMLAAGAAHLLERLRTA